MKNVKWINSFLCVLLSFYFAFAETSSALSLSELIEDAKLNNPEILAAEARWEAAQSRVSSVRHIMDPLVGIEFANSMRMYSVSQQFPFPTKLGTLSKFARTEVEEYENEYRQKEQEIISKVKKNYAQLFLIYKRIETKEESVVFLTQLFHIASLQYAIGKVPQADVLRAQIELAKAENDVLTLIDEKTVIETKLNLLLNRSPDEKLGVPVGLDTLFPVVKIEDLYALAREHRPALMAMRMQLNKAGVMLSIAKQKYLPDFMFKFTQQEMNNGPSDQKFMFGLTVPLWFWGKQNEMVREMNANLKMAEAHYQHMENLILLAVKEAVVTLDKSRRTALLYQNSILPQAEANLNSALTAYESNRIDFLSLLESEKVLIQSELDYYRAQAELSVAFADLEEAVGIDLNER
ncbi:MAG: TolC family protein [candidate division WOR-3 bacterium]|nr:MAG: TolC family protein [candidate division WOR-3 bacterium]